MTYFIGAFSLTLAAQVELSEPPSDAISSVKFAPESNTRLLVASWDKNIYLYDTKDGASGALIRKFEHRAPVLDVCFGANDNEAFSAGLDWGVKRSVCFEKFYSIQHK